MLEYVDHLLHRKARSKMHKLADDERELLRYYGERVGVISGPQ